MIAVGMIALLFGIWVEAVRMERAIRYREMIEFHARMQQDAHVMSLKYPDSAVSKEWEAYHATLRQKYERAIAHPWIIVPPDPPGPLRPPLTQ
jgi:hypothetical protein